MSLCWRNPVLIGAEVMWSQALFQQHPSASIQAEGLGQEPGLGPLGDEATAAEEQDLVAKLFDVAAFGGRVETAGCAVWIDCSKLVTSWIFTANEGEAHGHGNIGH